MCSFNFESLKSFERIRVLRIHRLNSKLGPGFNGGFRFGKRYGWKEKSVGKMNKGPFNS